MRIFRHLATIILPAVVCGLASAGDVAATPVPDTCGTPVRVTLLQNTAAIGISASGGIAGTVDGYEFRGNYELSTDDIRTLPVDFSASLDDGPARIVALVVTYEPYEVGDVQPEITLAHGVEPTLSANASILVKYDTEFVRLDSVYVDVALCGPLPETTVDPDDEGDEGDEGDEAVEAPVGGSSGALPSTGGADTTALVALAVLLLGAGAALIARRPVDA